MDREQLDNLIEKSILGLVIAALCYGPIAYGAVNKPHFLVVQALITLTLSLWLPRIWIGPKSRVFFPPTCWAVVAFVVYAGIRYWNADVEYIARREFLKIVTYASLFFIIVNNLNRQEHIRTICTALIAVGFCLSVYAIFQYLTDSKSILGRPQLEEFYGRASATYACPNHLAGFLEMLVPLSITMALLVKMSPVKRIVFGYVALVMLAGIGVTISRGGYISTVAGLVVLFGILFMKRGYRIALISGFTLLAIGGLWFVKSNRDVQIRFSDAFTPKSTVMVDMRTRMWEGTATLWKENFWFGVGPGHFSLRFPEVRPNNFQGTPEFDHNDYLNTLVDYGTIGLSLIILALVTTLLTILFALRRNSKLKSEPGKSKGTIRAKFLLVGGSIGLLTLTIHSLIDFNMHIPSNAVALVAILAMLACQRRHATSSKQGQSTLLGRMAISLLVIPTVAFLSFFTLRAGNEQLRVIRSNADGVPVLEKLALLEQAFKFDSANPVLAADIGEKYWLVGRKGGLGYEEQIESAIQWLTIAFRLNPFDYPSICRLGMSLDWVFRYEDAEPYFAHAEKNDPNGYYTMAANGWHYYMKQDYQTSLHYFRESKRLSDTVHMENPLVEEYLPFVEAKLVESRVYP